MTKLITIITPCYNELLNVREIHRRVMAMAAQLPQYRFEHLFVDNASKDGTPVNDPVAANISRNAYMSALGYARLNAAIPLDAVVQPNPSSPNAFWSLVDDVNIDRQRAIASDQPWCGSELGGDPGGCKPMAVAIDALFSGAT